jgi:hypothetical protein
MRTFPHTCARADTELAMTPWCYHCMQQTDYTQCPFAALPHAQVSETSEVASFPRPAQPLQLYEFQGCPFCRKVCRECSDKHSALF